MQLIDRQLSSQLSKQSLFPIYLICGDVPLLVKEATDKIRQAVQQAGYSQRELFFIENNQEWQRIKDSIENFSLFAEKNFD